MKTQVLNFYMYNQLEYMYQNYGRTKDLHLDMSLQLDSSDFVGGLNKKVNTSEMAVFIRTFKKTKSFHPDK